jgi:hypothetical protein
MKYWKGKIGSIKEGQCGTMDDNGNVPDSVSATQAEYLAWLAAIPAPLPSQLETDIAGLTFSALGDVRTKMLPILERLRKGER